MVLDHAPAPCERPRSLRTSRVGRPRLRRAARYVVESLEERILFAWNMTLSGNATVGVGSSVSPGTTTFTATATGANLNWSSIQTALQAGNAVVVTSGSTGTEAGNITDITGAQINTSVSNQLKFQSGSGTGLVGNITIEDINMSATGSTIVVNATGNVAVGQLCGGTYSSPTQISSITLTSVNGSISRLATPWPGPIEATTVGLGASTGIGASKNRLATTASIFSAGTATGGVFISNTGNLAITWGGIQDTGASGNIFLTNAGSITATTGTINGPGTITLTTSSGDILLGNYTSSNAGSLAFNAAGNLLIGDTVDVIEANIETGGNIVLSAGGNINVDNASVVTAHGAGTITATASGNISILDTNNAWPAALLATEGGAVTLTTGAARTVTLSSFTTYFGSHSIDTTRNGGSGNITINTDHFALDAATDNIAAGGGIVTIQPVASTEAIQLGTTTDAELDLSSAELGAISAGTLHVGNAADTANLTLTAAVSPPTVAALALQTGGTIFANAFADSITVPTLALAGGTGIGFATRPLQTQVANLSAETNTGSIYLSNTGNVVINGAVIGGVNGMQVMTSGIISFNNAGSITATTFGDIFNSSGNLSVTTSSGDIILGGFNGSGFDIYAGAANSSAGTVTLNAAGNLMIGDPTTGSYGDVISAGNITLIAGGNINVDENSYVSAHGTGTILATGANVSLLGTNGIFAAALATQGGAITLGGTTVTIDSSATTIGVDSISTARNGVAGPITVIADHFVLNATDDMVAGPNVVTIVPNTKSEAIALGDTNDTVLDLSNTELG